MHVPRCASRADVAVSARRGAAFRGRDSYADGHAQLSPIGVDDQAVSPLVRKTAAWAWRLLVLLAALVALLWVVSKVEVIVVPVALATMLAALLLPVVDWLDRRGAPRGGARSPWSCSAASRSSAAS